MSFIWFWKVLKWIRENALGVTVAVSLLCASGIGWVGRGAWDAPKLDAERQSRRACEAEVIVWKGAADANDRSRAQLEETLRAASKEWARVAEELRKAGEAQRAALQRTAAADAEAWARERALLTTPLPNDCDAAVAETVRRLKEVLQ